MLVEGRERLFAPAAELLDDERVAALAPSMYSLAASSSARWHSRLMTADQAVEIVGSAPSLIASQYEPASCSRVRPVSAGPPAPRDLGRAPPKRRVLSSCTPETNSALSALSGVLSRALSAEGGSDVPSVGCGNAMHERSVKSVRMAARVAFCSWMAADVPLAGCRHDSRYASGVRAAPSPSSSSSWKSRSSHVKRGKNCASASAPPALAAAASPSESLSLLTKAA